MAVIDFQKWQNDSGQGQSNNVFREDDGLDEDLRDFGEEDDGGYIDDEIEEVPARAEDVPVVKDKKYYFQRGLRVLLLSGLLIGIVFLIIMQSRTRVYGSASYRKVADIVAQEGTSYLPLGSNIVAYSRDGASCMSNNGSQIWNITYEMQEPIVAVSGRVIAIGDYNGSEIHIMNDSKTLGSVNTNMPIRGLAVSESGEVAAVLNDTDVTWVYLFDAEGNTIAYFKTTMGQSGYPLGVAISAGGEVVSVSHLTVGSATVNTSIAFYNFGPVGQNEPDNNVGGYNYDDEVFPYITYMDSDTCAAVSDKRLVFFNGDQIPKSGTNAMFDAEVEGVFSNEEYIVVLFPDTTGKEQYAMRVYNGSGTLVSTIPFSMDYTNIQLCSNRIVINNDQACLIYNVDGTLKYSGSFKSPVRAVIPMETSTNRLMVITDKAIEQMVLE
jgi:hypothetical protein